MSPVSRFPACKTVGPCGSCGAELAISVQPLTHLHSGSIRENSSTPPCFLCVRRWSDTVSRRRLDRELMVLCTSLGTTRLKSLSLSRYNVPLVYANFFVQTATLIEMESMQDTTRTIDGVKHYAYRGTSIGGISRNGCSRYFKRTSAFPANMTVDQRSRNFQKSIGKNCGCLQDGRA